MKKLMQIDTQQSAELIADSQSILQCNADLAQRIAKVLFNIQKERFVPGSNSSEDSVHLGRQNNASNLQFSETVCLLDISPSCAEDHPAQPFESQQQRITEEEKQILRELFRENTNLINLAHNGEKLADIFIELAGNTVQASAVINLLLKYCTNIQPGADLSSYESTNIQDFILSQESKRDGVSIFPVALKADTLLDVDFIFLIYRIANNIIMLVLHFPHSNLQRYTELKKTHFLDTVPIPSHPSMEAVALFHLADVPTVIRSYQDFIVLGFATGEVTVYSINCHIVQFSGFSSPLINPSLLKLFYTYVSTSHTPLISTISSRSYLSPIRSLIVTDVTAKSNSLRTKQMTLNVIHESNCIATMNLTLDFVLEKKGQKIYSQRTVVEPATVFEILSKHCLSIEKQTVFASAVSAGCEFVHHQPLSITGHMAGTVVVRLAASGGVTSTQSLTEVSKYLAGVASNRCPVFETPVISLVHGVVPGVCQQDEEVVVACSLGGQLSSWIIRPKNMVAGLPLLSLDDEAALLFAPYYVWQGKADCGEAVISATLHNDKVILLTVSNRVVQYKIFKHAIAEVEDKIGTANMLDSCGSFLILVNQTQLSLNEV